VHQFQHPGLRLPYSWCTCRTVNYVLCMHTMSRNLDAACQIYGPIFKAVYTTAQGFWHPASTFPYIRCTCREVISVYWVHMSDMASRNLDAGCQIYVYKAVYRYTTEQGFWHPASTFSYIIHKAHTSSSNSCISGAHDEQESGCRMADLYTKQYILQSRNYGARPPNFRTLDAHVEQ